MMNDEQDSDSSLITPHSSLPLPPTNPHTTSKTGFFEQTMNAQTTFVSPVTEYEIASPTFEAAAEADISEEISRSPNREIPVQAQAVVQNTQRHFAERSDELSDNKVHEAQNSEDAFVVSADTAPLPAVVTEEEYRFLHGSENGAMPLKGDSEPPAEMKQTTSEQAEQISSAPQPAESQPGGAATGGDAAWTAPLVHAGLNLMETPPDTPNITSAPLESALYELVTALQAPAEPVQTASETFCACVVCRLSARSVERWLRTFLAEYVNDPAAREQLRRAQGFCVAHTNVLSHLGDALAIAILYADLSRLTRERWQRQTPLQASASFWKRLRSDNRSPHLPDAPCPACLQQQEADARYVRALAAGLDHPTAQATVWNALEVNPGLCVPHTEQIVQASTPPAAARLLQMEDARLTELQGELEEIIRKNDYRFRGEAWGEEKTAWKRALDKLRRSESGE